MKSIFISFLLLLIFCSNNAQNNTTVFAPYQQNIDGSTLSFKMIPIQAGKFIMGSKATEKNRKADEGPQKEIQIPAFWMGAYEVTRDELDVFLKDESTSQNITMDAITRPIAQYVDLSWGMGKEVGYPANSMSQRTAIMYCRWLYEKTKIFYRLPTEAEWEYACRAGTQTAYYFGNDPALLGKHAWYVKNSEDKFHKVGLKLPNPWGLYDMLGNLMEWTLNHYTPNAYLNYKSIDSVPVANPKKYPKSVRGGGFSETAIELRSANRLHSDPVWNKRDPQIPKSKWWLTEAKNIGIRLVRPLVQPTEQEINEFFQTYLFIE